MEMKYECLKNLKRMQTVEFRNNLRNHRQWWGVQVEIVVVLNGASLQISGFLLHYPRMRSENIVTY